MNRGFTVIELLIALAIVMSITGVLAQLVEPARAAFDRVPAELDLQQRGRTAIDAISQVVRSAGKNVAATNGLGALSKIMAPISLANPDQSGQSFASMTAIVPVVDGAQGVLGADQNAAAGPLMLATTPCPDVNEVCGFVRGVTAVIVDGSGHYEVFVVASTTAGSRMLTADRGFMRAYPAGSAVIEIDQYTFSLAVQADGSFSLVRATAAGAVQPMVDFVTALSFHVSDQQVDFSVTVGAATEVLRRVLGDRMFRSSIGLRNAS
jgi:prepilin-type N-terminal cleavage/methylation domain-containing protein